MKSSIFIIVTICLLATITSCNRHQADIDYTAEKTIVIDPGKPSPVSDFFEACEDFDVIPLKGSKEPIGQITNISQHAGDFYIFEKRRSIIHCYDSNGNFKYRIDKKGRGPKEYLVLTNYCFQGNILWVLDLRGGKLLRFDAGTGDFIDTIPYRNNTAYEAVGIVNDSIIALSAQRDILRSDRTYIHLLNSSGKTICKLLDMGEEYERRMDSYESTPQFYTFDNSLFVSFPMDNRIFSITEDAAKVKYFFDFGKQDINRFIMSNTALSDDDFDTNYNTQKICTINSPIIEKDDYIITGLAMGENAGIMLYDKQNDRAQVYNKSFSRPYMLMGASSAIFNGEKDKLITYAEAFRAAETLKALEDQKEPKGEQIKHVYELYKQYGNINAQDNPVLLVFRMKH